MIIMIERALVTSSEERTSEWLRSERVGVLPFGNDQYGVLGLFCGTSAEALARVGEVKGREVKEKPLFVTAGSDNIEYLLSHHGISGKVSESALEVVGRLLTMDKKGEPLGVMLEADPNANIPRGIYSTDIIKFKGEYVPAIGLMISGGNKQFSTVTNELKEYNGLVAGTSANITGDPKSFGSGHTHLGGALRDFGDNPLACIFVPNQHGPYRPHRSTSVAFVNNAGTEAQIIRVGSIPLDGLVTLLMEAGIGNVTNDHDQIKEIKEYVYSPQDLLINWVVDRYARLRLKNEGEFYWPTGLTSIPQLKVSTT